ncbi:MAG TPA: hypothetical protein DDZ88_22230 [Verrucomicrobiales bacterium]|nr:hypothetical protein [Verrucomicrobiales bacterium]
MYKTLQIISWLLQLIIVLALLTFLFGLCWFAYDLTKEGISSNGMTWESVPPGGWSKWRREQWLGALPELMLVEGVLGLFIWPLLVFLRRLFGRFPALTS